MDALKLLKHLTTKNLPGVSLELLPFVLEGHMLGVYIILRSTDMGKNKTHYAECFLRLDEITVDPDMPMIKLDEMIESINIRRTNFVQK